jgi:hypothetical protein
VLVEGARFGQLVGSVGGEYFIIGESAEIVMPSSGELNLGMNDRDPTGYPGNEGALSVSVSLLTPAR